MLKYYPKHRPEIDAIIFMIIAGFSIGYVGSILAAAGWFEHVSHAISIWLRLI